MNDEFPATGVVFRDVATSFMRCPWFFRDVSTVKRLPVYGVLFYAVLKWHGSGVGVA